MFDSDFFRILAGILVIQGGQLDEDEEEGIFYFAKMVHDLKTLFPFVTYYTKYVRSFDGFWGFMVACKVDRCGDSPVVNPEAAPSLVDKLIAERIDPTHKYDCRALLVASVQCCMH